MQPKTSQLIKPKKTLIDRILPEGSLLSDCATEIEEVDIVSDVFETHSDDHLHIIVVKPPGG